MHVHDKIIAITVYNFKSHPQMIGLDTPWSIPYNEVPYKLIRYNIIRSKPTYPTHGGEYDERKY